MKKNNLKKTRKKKREEMGALRTLGKGHMATDRLKIAIDTRDRRLSSDLLGDSGGVDLPGDAKLSLVGVVKKYAAGAPETIELILTLGGGVAVNLVAMWIYDKIKGRASHLRIKETEVKINKGEIESIIVREIERKD